MICSQCLALVVDGVVVDERGRRGKQRRRNRRREARTRGEIDEFATGAPTWLIHADPSPRSLAAPLTSCTSPPSPLVHRLPPFLFPQLPAQDKLRTINTTFRPQGALSLSLASRCRPLSSLDHRLPAQETCELIASPPTPLAFCLLFVSSLFCCFPLLLAATINTKYSHMVLVCKGYLTPPRWISTLWLFWKWRSHGTGLSPITFKSQETEVASSRLSRQNSCLVSSSNHEH